MKQEPRSHHQWRSNLYYTAARDGEARNQHSKFWSEAIHSGSSGSTVTVWLLQGEQRRYKSNGYEYQCSFCWQASAIVMPKQSLFVSRSTPARQRAKKELETLKDSEGYCRRGAQRALQTLLFLLVLADGTLPTGIKRITRIAVSYSMCSIVLVRKPRRMFTVSKEATWVALPVNVARDERQIGQFS